MPLGTAHLDRRRRGLHFRDDVAVSGRPVSCGATSTSFSTRRSNATRTVRGEIDVTFRPPASRIMSGVIVTSPVGARAQIEADAVELALVEPAQALPRALDRDANFVEPFRDQHLVVGQRVRRRRRAP